MSVRLPYPSDSRGASLCGARVLVTGARGFIGTHLRHALSEQGAETFVLRRQPTAASDESARVVRVDMNDRAELARALRELAPDVVFHLGGYVSGDRSAEAMIRVARATA